MGLCPLYAHAIREIQERLACACWPRSSRPRAAFVTTYR
jgi:hypothetical protein